MTITNRIVLTPTDSRPSHRDVALPPPHLYPAPDPPFRGYTSPPSDAYASSMPSTAIVIDNGSSILRAGWSFDKRPRVAVPAIMARYRDRKLNKPCQFVGWDAYADATTRGQIRTAFEPGSNLVSAWDVLEGVLDYTFLRLGLGSGRGRGEVEGSIGRPIVMTEPLANLAYSRRTMNELLFEAYGTPSVAYGVDALLSYKYNGGRSGLVVSSGHAATHLIPVLDGKPILNGTSRLNWGGWHAADYMFKLLRLKYPTFPGKMTETQVQEYVRQHCYISRDFEREMSGYLDWSGLEDRERVIQYPFTEQVVVEKSEEELARIAERKKESGRRLQEQAAKMRLDKLVQKEQELEYFKDLKVRLENATKKEQRRLLDDEEMRDEESLDRTMRELEKRIKKARAKDLGQELEEDAEEPPSFPLLDIPDDQLDEAGLKAKRHQRLMKSGFDARARARAEKEEEEARAADQQRADEDKRANNLKAWLEDKRQARNLYLQKMKDRERMKADLGNRKSLASQMRMKTLANLAADGPRKRRRGGNPDRDDDDTFGANDDDWGVYRTVQVGEPGGSDDEDEEDPAEEVRRLEAILLQHDPEFDESKTLDAQGDWSKSLIHAFLRGPRPFDQESAREAHQLHLNVERIRVPEVIFQPSIAGVDQAGIIEIVVDILMQRVQDPGEREAMLKDVFMTGGNTMFDGFKERFQKELRACLPVESVMNVRSASDPLLDAWRGAAQWAGEDGFGRYVVSRDEYLEKGSDYLKEHEYGNGSPVF